MIIIFLQSRSINSGFKVLAKARTLKPEFIDLDWRNMIINSKQCENLYILDKKVNFFWDLNHEVKISLYTQRSARYRLRYRDYILNVCFYVWKCTNSFFFCKKFIFRIEGHWEPNRPLNCEETLFSRSSKTMFISPTNEVPGGIYRNHSVRLCKHTIFRNTFLSNNQSELLEIWYASLSRSTILQVPISS